MGGSCFLSQVVFFLPHAIHESLIHSNILSKPYYQYINYQLDALIIIYS